MEIIARNLPASVTRNQVEQFFRERLAEVLIYAYHFKKLKGRTYVITVGNGQKAQNFLERYNAKNGLQLLLDGQRIHCVPGDENLDQFLVKSLVEEDHEKSATVSQTPQSRDKRYQAIRRKFNIESLSCGRWAYDDYGDLLFATQFKEFRKGTMLFGSRSLIIDLEPYYRKGLPTHRLEIPYTNIESFTRGPATNPTATFSLLAPPRLFEELQSPENDKRGFNSKEQGTKAPKNGFKRKRIMALRSEHIPVVSSCLCYRVKLQQWAEVWALVDLQESIEIPKSISRDSLEVMKLDYLAQVNALNSLLAGPEYPRFSFEVKFQFQRLAQNGYLSPGEVAELFQHTYPVSIRRFKDTALIAALRKLSVELPFPGPQTQASALSVETLSGLLTLFQEQASKDSAYVDPADQYEHMAWVHRATVTPTGIVLKGPELQVVNRVLRR
ncbi:hypothetical protein MMC31_000453 [Peltigera leucophlebia]|nr:hypothetical protein [Peltigera leucophlebia]